MGKTVLSRRQSDRGVKLTYLSASRAELKNQWSYTSTLPTWLHGVDRDNYFTFTNVNHGAIKLTGANSSRS